MKLLVVIVSYRVTDLTIDCLRSLGGVVDEVQGTRVAVCENGTGGDAERRLRLRHRRERLGFLGGSHGDLPQPGIYRGQQRRDPPGPPVDDPPEYVLLLNADTIVQEHALDTLVAFMDDHPEAGIAGSMLLSPEGTVETSPFRFPGIATELDRGLRLGIVSKLFSPWGLVLPKPRRPCRVDWVAGASMILRRTMLEQIGLLDEGLYTYFDDPDICLRAVRAGWETWYVPESRVIHLEGAINRVPATGPPPRRPAYWHQARRRSS